MFRSDALHSRRLRDLVFSSAPVLLAPARFLADAREDLRHSLVAAWPLFRSNMRARHRRAWLGYFWLLLPALATTLIWVYVRAHGIVSVADTHVPYPVHVLTGMILWQIFVDALNAPLQQLGAGRAVITRSRVPHEALMLAGLLEVIVNSAARLLVLAMVLAVFRVPLASTAIFVPIGFAALAMLGLALGILIAPVGMLYDDVSRGLMMVTTFWFFLTPVIYAVPRAGLVRFNPVTPLLDTTRAWLFGGTGTHGFALVAIASTILLVIAWFLQRLARPHITARLG